MLPSHVGEDEEYAGEVGSGLLPQDGELEGG